MDQLVTTTQTSMQKALDVLKSDIATIRTGRAAPSLVEEIVIPAYGGSTRMKVMELATVTALDAQTLVITPFDASIIGEIQKGIQESNTGLTPVIDSTVVRISIPPLSQERREQLIHLMKQKLEHGKIMMRQSRHDAMNELKKQELSEDEAKRLEKEIQKATDEFIEKIDLIGKEKEKELTTI